MQLRWCANLLLAAVFVSPKVALGNSALTDDDVAVDDVGTRQRRTVTSFAQGQPIVDFMGRPVGRSFNAAQMEIVRSIGLFDEHKFLAKLQLRLSDELARINACCSLNEQQLQKLNLAIRGEVERSSTMWKQFELACATEPPLQAPQIAELRGEFFRKLTLPSIEPFSESCVYFKTMLKRQLTAEQQGRIAQLETVERKNHIRMAIADCYRGDSTLNDLQLDTLQQIVLSRYSGCRIPKGTNLSMYVMMMIATDLGDELKPHLTDEQWQLTHENTITARRFEPMLRGYGLWPVLSH